jgi:hypothetical protein
VRKPHVLGVSRARLGQLADEDRVAFVRHRDGMRLYRRGQFEIVASIQSVADTVSNSNWVPLVAPG